MSSTRIHFVADGFTHGNHVFLTGESTTVDTDKYPIFDMSLEDQIKTYGAIYFKKGAWDGALFDTDDPKLSPNEKKKLEAANAKILAERMEEEKAKEAEIAAKLKASEPESETLESEPKPAARRTTRTTTTK